MKSGLFFTPPSFERVLLHFKQLLLRNKIQIARAVFIFNVQA